jgi:hypothetical protein
MDDGLQSIIARINDAFFKLESFMNGSLSQYQYFDFNLEFTKLFSEVNKYQNHTAGNLDLIDSYWILMQNLSIDFDRGPIKNKDVWDNLDFQKVVKDLNHLHWNRIEEFGQFFPDQMESKSISISEIIGEFSGTKGKTKNPQKKTSYVWQTKPDQELPELFGLMINKYKLIAPETTLEQFTAVFTGQAIESINPIRWHQDNASELLYFIGRLEETDNVVHNPKRADYQKMTTCFVKPDGKPFTANWKQINQTININLSPEKQKAIDELVSTF